MYKGARGSGTLKKNDGQSYWPPSKVGPPYPHTHTDVERLSPAIHASHALPPPSFPSSCQPHRFLFLPLSPSLSSRGPTEKRAETIGWAVGSSSTTTRASASIMRRLHCRAGTFSWDDSSTLPRLKEMAPYTFYIIIPAGAMIELKRATLWGERKKEVTLTQGQVGAFVRRVPPLDGIDQGYCHTREMPFMNKLQHIPAIKMMGF